jgi:hypothetical protein
MFRYVGLWWACSPAACNRIEACCWKTYHLPPRDFKAADLSVMPGHVLSDEEQRDEDMREQLEYENDTRIGDDF